jgi:hypothetical protein
MMSDDKMIDQSYPTAAATPVTIPMGTADRVVKTRVSNDAEKSFLLGILSFFCCPICISPYAIHLGVRAKKEIKENPNEVTGECKANSGIATASIAMILSVVFTIIFILYFMKAYSEAEAAAMNGN